MFGKMGVEQQAHRSGALKQKNKAHKTGRHRSKGIIDNDQKGKVFELYFPFGLHLIQKMAMCNSCMFLQPNQFQAKYRFSLSLVNRKMRCLRNNVEISPIK